MHKIFLLITLICMLAVCGCDKSSGGSIKQKFNILETRVYTPSKITVDVDLLQSKGIVVMVTVLDNDQVYEIGQLLYAEDQTWRVEGQNPYGHTHPHQINQFIYRYAGYQIDTRETITLIKVGETVTPNPTP